MLDSLPPELLLHILTLLEGSDLARLCCVSTTFRAVCSEDSIWKGRAAEALCLGFNEIDKPPDRSWREHYRRVASAPGGSRLELLDPSPPLMQAVRVGGTWCFLEAGCLFRLDGNSCMRLVLSVLPDDADRISLVHGHLVVSTDGGESAIFDSSFDEIRRLPYSHLHEIGGSVLAYSLRSDVFYVFPSAVLSVCNAGDPPAAFASKSKPFAAAASDLAPNSMVADSFMATPLPDSIDAEGTYSSVLAGISDQHRGVLTIGTRIFALASGSASGAAIDVVGSDPLELLEYDERLQPVGRAAVPHTELRPVAFRSCAVHACAGRPLVLQCLFSSFVWPISLQIFAPHADRASSVRLRPGLQPSMLEPSHVCERDGVLYVLSVHSEALLFAFNSAARLLWSASFQQPGFVPIGLCSFFDATAAAAADVDDRCYLVFCRRRTHRALAFR